MKLKRVEKIQNDIGYKFKNLGLLQQAYTRSSYSHENGGTNNEVLEFIGDKVLDFIVVKLLTEKYCSVRQDNEGRKELVSLCSEGELTEKKKKLVCKEMLSNRIKTFGLQYSLIMGKSDVEKKVCEEDSVREDLFEAILGAVAIDSNFDVNVLSGVVDMMLEPNFYLDNDFDGQKNYVELVQKWAQKKHDRIPLYSFRNGLFSGFVCDLVLPNIDVGFEMVGNSKSELRMAVAKKAYQYIEENGLLLTLEDEIGKPSIEKSINQLQELYQKRYISKPLYVFSESYDENGNPIWYCKCQLDGNNEYVDGNFKSKKEGKKVVSYNMLCKIFKENEIK